MKLSLPACLLAASSSCDAYTMPSLSRTPTFLKSSQTSEAAFSAFADSLDEEPEEEVSSEKPWQAKLEDLLDPMTDLAERQILFSELMDSNDAIRESVLDALANRKLDPLLTPKAQKLQDGTRAVVRQIANDILPQISKGPQSFPPSPQSLEKVGSRLFNVVTNQIQKNIEDLQEDLTDPINKIPQRLTKQTEDLVQEAKNMFLETPEGLQEPSYTVIESCDLYEVREYEAYTVASTVMEAGEDLATAGTAFNALAAYLFGENDQSKLMEMTTPVTTTNLGEMRFYLGDNNIPEPLTSSETSIEIIEVPAARLAVRKFTGFATDGEVARQKDTLLQALEMDGIELDVAHGAVVPYFVFQYNPPYTIPMVRRNEVAVPVRDSEVESVTTSLKQEWNVDEGTENEVSTNSAPEEDVSPSD